MKDYLFVVLKRKWLILSLVLVITSLVAIQSFRAPSIYEGETVIRIQQKHQTSFRPTRSLSTDRAIPTSGARSWLLQNPALARQVVLTLDLPHNPAFFGSQSQTGIFDSLRRMFSSPRVPPSGTAQVPGGLAVNSESQNKLGRLTPEEIEKLEAYEDAIIAGEVIEPIPNTNLVKIIYRHSDPELAEDRQHAGGSFQKLQPGDSDGRIKAEDLGQRDCPAPGADQPGSGIQWNYAKSHNLPLTTEGAGNLEAKDWLR